MIVSLSILSADLLNLHKTIDSMLKFGVDRLHLDVMDGSFVKKIAFGEDWLSSIKKAFPLLPIDVHLMVTNLSIEQFNNYKNYADKVYIHLTTKTDFCHNSYVLNLDDDINLLPLALQNILLMSVSPGRGGQKFNSNVYKNIYSIKEKFENIYLSVDGGVDLSRARELSKCGINEVILGSGLLFDKNPADLIKSLHDL